MPTSTVQLSLQIPDTEAGQRLDQALARLLPDYSRSRLKTWIEAGEVLVDGAVRRPRDKVNGGERVEVAGTVIEESTAAAQAIPLLMAYEDKHVFIVDKPAGLVVHPGAGNPDQTLQNALLSRDPELGMLPRAGIVHRLDKDTSGLLIVARTLKAHTALVRMLEAREIHREYETICRGVMTAGGTIDAPIDRHPTDRVRMAIRDGGRDAITHYRVIRRFRAHTHVRVELETGRTHQIRVHLAHAGHPIVGDRIYGRAYPRPGSRPEEEAASLRTMTRHALHAYAIRFRHPRTGAWVELVAPLPRDFRTVLELVFGSVPALAPSPAEASGKVDEHR